MFGRREATLRRQALAIRRILRVLSTRGAVATAVASAAVTALPATAPAAELPTTRASDTRPAGPVDAMGDPLPPGAVQRLGTVRLRGRDLRSATFTADGKTLLTVYTGGRLRFWDADSGRPTRSAVLPPVPGGVFTATEFDVRFTPDGRLVMPGSAGGAVLLDADALTVTSRRPAKAKPGSGGGAAAGSTGRSSVAVSADGKRLAVARAGGVAVGDSSGDAPLTWAGGPPARNVAGLELSADGSVLLAWGTDGTVRWWDGRTGAVRHAIAPVLDRAAAATVAPDGKRIAVVADGDVWVYDAATGRPDPRPLGDPRRGGPPAAADVGDPGGEDGGAGDNDDRLYASSGAADDPVPAFATVAAPTGGPMLAVWGRGAVRVWDVDANRVLATVRTTPPPTRPTGIRQLTWSPDGKRLAVVTPNGACDLVDVSNGRLVADAGDDGASAEIVHALAASPDGNTVVTATGNRLTRWDARTGRPLPRPAVLPPPPARPDLPDPLRPGPLDPFRTNPFYPASPSNPITAVAFSPDGSVVWRRDGRSVAAWDAATLAGLAGWTGAVPPSPTDPPISPDGRLSVGLTAGNKLAVRDPSTGRVLHVLDLPADSGPQARAAASQPARAEPADTRPAADRPAADPAADAVRPADRRPRGPQSIAYGPGGLLAVCDLVGVHLWDAAKNERVRTFPVPPDGTVRARVSPAGDRVAAQTPDGITVWAADSGEVVQHLTGAGGQFEFSPAGHLMVTAGRSNRRVPPVPPAIANDSYPTLVWDLATGVPVGALTADEPRAAVPPVVAFLPDGRRLVTARADVSGPLVWDLAAVLGPDPEVPADALPRVLMDELWRRLDSDDPVTALRAATALSDRPAEAVVLLRERLADVPGERRPARAALALAWAGTPAARALLDELAADAKVAPHLRAAARASLKRFPAADAAAAGRLTWSGMLVDPADAARRERPAGGERPAAGGEPVAARDVPSTRPARRPFTDGDVARIAADPFRIRSFAEAGDGRLVPKLFEWLDVPPPRPRGFPQGHPEFFLRAVLEGLAVLRVREAVPKLIEAHDRPGTDVADRPRLVQAVARIGGPAATAFLRDRFADGSLARPVRLQVAAALAEQGDAAAVEYLFDRVEGERGRAGRDRSSRLSHGPTSPVGLLRLSADPKVADRLDAIAAAEADPRVALALRWAAEEVWSNAVPPDELLGRVRETDPDQAVRRLAAIAALGRRGGPDAIAALESLPAWDRDLPPDPGRPAVTRASLAYAGWAAADEVRRRHWRALSPATGPATGPAPAAR